VAARIPEGPGLFEITRPDGDNLPDGTAARFITNVRRLAGTGREPGSALIGWAAWLLAALGGGLLYVSFSGQYQYIFAARQQHAPAMIEAAMFDVGMIIFTLLALGLAMAGKPARTERALIMICSFGSAGMNYSAADTASPRSVIAYTAAPVFLSIVVDRVIAVIRRHVLGDSETSAWTALGYAALTMARVLGLILLYLLRFTLATPSTAQGLRRMVLDAAPIPGLITIQALTGEQGTGPERPALEPEVPGLETSAAQLLAAYRAHPEYGVRSALPRIAAELAQHTALDPAYAALLIQAELLRLDDPGRDEHPTPEEVHAP
jgi:hypothetical protein